MSGEFGSCCSGYLHSQMAYAAEDLAGGSLEITRQWAPLMESFAQVARAICWAEACDSGEDWAITVSLREIDALKAAIKKVEDYLRPFEQVAERAVRDALEKAREGKQ